MSDDWNAGIPSPKEFVELLKRIRDEPPPRRIYVMGSPAYIKRFQKELEKRENDQRRTQIEEE